ncbi:pyrroline-5-carboxylate reductase [Leptospira ryugenii]|uniref:Pyrroline-5-carboxylate reductase n=1 Tax=Leptospira ryugenii TaxID=1917863 RepID=A0A2P2DY76_9LEPT|nr:pyrroline-5-carboxylate reductase [Leptospira ryugenii]GBF49581.1 pyrroline-5-carboxylate reductase [Leptospira ryugenii]
MAERIGIIGLGKMGEAIARSLYARTQSQVFGYDPFTKTRQPFVSYQNSIADLEAVADVLVVAVKPADVTKVLGECKQPKVFLSIAAGISVETMQSASPKGSQVVRMMPNLPLLVGKGAIGYFTTSKLDDLVSSVFFGLGLLVKVDKEAHLDAITGLSGSGPAFVLSFLQGLAEGGLKEGLTYSQSLDLALQTIEGSISYFKHLKEEDPNIHPMEVRNWVTSPAGTTIHGLDALERAGFMTAVRDAVASATNRSRELGKGG